MTRFHPHASPFVRPLVCAAVLAFVSQATLARTSCSFTSVSPLNFGVYEVFATAPNNNGVGSFTIDCSGAGNHTFSVTLSTGHSQSYASRTMRSVGNHLDYNLYTSAGRSAVWGDGTGGSQVVTATKNRPATFSVFGQIPFGQDVEVGTYTDNITAIVNF